MEEENNGSMSKYIDKNVIYFLVAMLFVSSSAMTYRFYGDFDCGILDMEIEGNEYRVGEFISFADLTEKAENWEWDFGDSTEVSTRRKVSHTYKKSGKYIVKLFVNNTCEISKNITIQEKKIILDPNKIPKLILPESITVGETLKVTDSTKDAYSWEWRFDETAKANLTTKTASYIYDKPGEKTVRLIVNGDIDHQAIKIINVYPKRIKQIEIRDTRGRATDVDLEEGIPYYPGVDEDSEKPSYKNISEGDFEGLINEIAGGTKNREDAMEYFCDNEDRTITVNKKNISFSSFCAKIKNKKIKVKELTIEKEDNNCIKSVTIKYGIGIFSRLFN